MEEVLQHRTPSQCLGLSPTRTCKLDRSRMSSHPNTPAQFSAGVGQEPQTPALAPRPHPAQILRYTLYRIGTKYRSGQIPDHLLDLSELLAWGARRNYSIMAAFGRYA